MLVNEKLQWEAADNRMNCGKEACLAYVAGLQALGREDKIAYWFGKANAKVGRLQS